MNARKLLIAAALLLAYQLSATAASLTIQRQTRMAIEGEIDAGAPAGSLVHEFFITSDTDLLCIGNMEISIPLYQHRLGRDDSAPESDVLELNPAAAADSYITMPGETLVLGGGFSGGPGGTWFDLSNDGPQFNFKFAQLTTTEAGRFAGEVFVLTNNSNNEMVPFSFDLPGAADALDSVTTVTAEYPLDPPPATVPPPVVPTPTVEPPLPFEPPLVEPPALPEPPPLGEPIDNAPHEPTIVADPPALATEPPLVVVVPISPIIDETIERLDVPPPEIRIGYDQPMPGFQREWLWNCDAIDFTLVGDGPMTIDANYEIDAAAWQGAWRLRNDIAFMMYDGALNPVQLMTPQLLGGAVHATNLQGGMAYALANDFAAVAVEARIPEPATTLLAAIALLSLSAARRR